MVFRSFSINVVLQIAMMLIVCVTIAYLVSSTNYYATILLLSGVLGIQVYALLQYVQRTNRDLSRFLLSVKESDFSQSFSAHHVPRGFAELADQFEEVFQRFRDTRAEKEQQRDYLETLVQHVPVAILASDESGRVDLFNNAARRLFGVSTLPSLRALDEFGPDLSLQLNNLEPGYSHLIKATRDNETLHLNVATTSLSFAGRNLKIFSMQDIHGQLEAQEIVAWQNLIRVLTHEIVNSVTPISSLAATAGELLNGTQDGGSDADAIRDAREAVDTISKRSEGLLNFVENYRRLTRIPAPTFQVFEVRDLFSRIGRLMRPDLERSSISFRTNVSPETLELNADLELLEQALINLIRNAVDAVEQTSTPAIHLSAGASPKGRVVLAVEDNGQGITDDVKESIFVPFFTTKRHGTGVGLTLVRQIVRSHQGNINVQSAPDKGTCIQLIL